MVPRNAARQKCVLAPLVLEGGSARVYLHWNQQSGFTTANSIGSPQWYGIAANYGRDFRERAGSQIALVSFYSIKPYPSQVLRFL